MESIIFENTITRALLGDGHEALMDHPLHIRRAFSCVGVCDDPYNYDRTPEEGAEEAKKSINDLVRENVHKFAQRWGELEEAALKRALQEDTGIDRLKAIFAIGYSPFPNALNTIAPYRESSNRIERCATACVLGVQRDGRALEGLKEFYQQDDVDASGKMISEAEYWYQNYYVILALVLANWGPPEMTEVLRSTLLRINSLAYQPTIQYSGNEYTPTYLFYALGRRGCFSILDEAQLSERGRCMALFSLAAGYLRLCERYENHFWAISQYGDLHQEIVTMWKKHFGLSDQEIQKCFAVLNHLGGGLFSSVWWTQYE